MFHGAFTDEPGAKKRSAKGRFFWMLVVQVCRCIRACTCVRSVTVFACVDACVFESLYASVCVCGDHVFVHVYIYKYGKR